MSQYLKNLDLVTHERHYGKLRSLGLDAEEDPCVDELGEDVNKPCTLILFAVSRCSCARIGLLQTSLKSTVVR